MKPFFSSRISQLGSFITLCVLSITTFSTSAIADPIRELQNEAIKRGKSPEDVNQAMKAKFPESDFPYFEPVNGCSAPWYVDGDGWNEVFESACNNHDICYTTPGNKQPDCNKQMFREMMAICKNVSLYRRMTCPRSAEIYYIGVEQFGTDLYTTAQKQQKEYIKAVYAWLSTPNATVFLTNSYISTGMSVKPGDRIRIRATGTIIFGRFFARSGGPNGIIFNPRYNYFVDVPHGRLMARFRRPGMRDLDDWFPIGVGWDQVREVQFPSPGILEFLVNDNQPGDNRGNFRIEITTHSGKQ